MYGSDAANAMEPADFKLYCASIREVATMLGHPVDKDDVTPYRDMKRIFEKSVVTAPPVERRHAHRAQASCLQEARRRHPGRPLGAGRRPQARRDVPADHKLSVTDID